MGTQKHSWQIEKAHQGVRLDRFLVRALGVAWRREVTPAEAQQALASGAVSLDGRPERKGATLLQAGAQLEVYIGDACRGPKDRVPPEGTPRVLKVPALGPSQILFEDDWLIAADKPVGIPTQPTLDPTRSNLFGLLESYLRARDGATAYLGLHHRLDRDTSGVVLFTKRPEANAGVTALFTSRALKKTYQALAVVGGGGPDAWEVRNHLGVVARAGKVNQFGAVRSGGDAAHTSFVVVERFAHAGLFQAQPHTGRTHQIRVHLAECGHPILGDPLYGGPTELLLSNKTKLSVDRVLLHAGALVFPHPITQTEVKIVSPLPGDFAGYLARLRRDD